MSSTLCVSIDGKVVATKTDMVYCRGRTFPADVSWNSASAMYTHAFDFATGNYIETPDPCGGSEATRQTRHDEISALLEGHGGVGTTYQPTWSPSVDPTMRKMGYWEWKRWERRLEQARAAEK